MSAVLGVDGCPGGWIGAQVEGDAVRWLLLPDAAAIRAVPAVAIAIDMPIGLPAAGRRDCDVLARRRLGARRGSVFPAPVRAVLAATDYADACGRSRAACGRALSKQAWHLVPRIADLDAALSPADDARIVEAHPELAFRSLAGALPSKHTAEGRARRTAALAQWLPAPCLDAVPRPARITDALDALACAWVAARWAAGRAEVLPEAPERDGRGRPMRIVC